MSPGRGNAPPARQPTETTAILRDPRPSPLGPGRRTSAPDRYSIYGTPTTFRLAQLPNFRKIAKTVKPVMRYGLHGTVSGLMSAPYARRVIRRGRRVFRTNWMSYSAFIVLIIVFTVNFYCAVIMMVELCFIGFHLNENLVWSTHYFVTFDEICFKTKVSLSEDLSSKSLIFWTSKTFLKYPWVPRTPIPWMYINVILYWHPGVRSNPQILNTNIHS